MAAVRKHWEMWNRVFAYVNTPPDKRAAHFAPDSPITTLTTSPLAAAIATSWTRADQETLTSGFERLAVSVGPASLRVNEAGAKFFNPQSEDGSTIFWLRAPQDDLNVDELAELVGLSITNLAKSASAMRIHQTIKEVGPFSAEAKAAMGDANRDPHGVVCNANLQF